MLRWNGVNEGGHNFKKDTEINALLGYEQKHSGRKNKDTKLENIKLIFLAVLLILTFLCFFILLEFLVFLVIDIYAWFSKLHPATHPLQPLKPIVNEMLVSKDPYSSSGPSRKWLFCHDVTHFVFEARRLNKLLTFKK